LRPSTLLSSSVRLDLYTGLSMSQFDLDTVSIGATENYDWWSTLQYTTSFDELKSHVLESIQRWYPRRNISPLNLDGIEACVAIKNSDRIIVYQNRSFQHFFAGGHSAVGKGVESIAYWKTVQLTQKTDDLILDGVQSIDCEHVGRDPEGQHYSFRTSKSKLAEFQDPGYCLFGMSRPLTLLATSEKEKAKSLAELFKLFQAMDPVDQTICRLDAKGESTKDIAARVGLTSRSIENRRNRMIVLFGAQRPMGLVRITIRLEDHGLLPA